MIIEKIRKIFLNKKTTNFLLPIEQAEAYYRDLESRSGNRLNPFKRLTTETDWDSKKSCIPYSDSRIKLSMNQFHLVRYFRQNFAYLDVRF